MKRWRCPVCDYVHEGDAPPETCPVCTAPGELFTEEPAGAVDDEPAETGGDEPAVVKDREPADPAPEDGSPASPPRRWRCTVCGYVHEGEAPPDSCPVCAQPWHRFAPLVEGAGGGSVSAETGDAVTDDAVTDDTPAGGLGGLIASLHAHPVTSHIPNGGLPLSLMAWIAYLVLDHEALGLTSIYLLLAAALVIPVTFASGWSDAVTRYGSSTGGVFPQKKVLGVVLSVTTLAAAVWLVLGGLGTPPAGAVPVTIYTVLLVAANGLAVRLGMLGGKLVFGR